MPQGFLESGGGEEEVQDVLDAVVDSLHKRVGLVHGLACTVSLNRTVFVEPHQSVDDRQVAGAGTKLLC